MAGWLAVACLAWGPAVAAAATDNASCQTCHDAKAPKIEIQTTGDEKRPLRAIADDKYGQAVHGKLQCVACHTNIAESPPAGAGHTKEVVRPAMSRSCIDCHQALWDEARRDGQAAAKPRLGVVAQNIDAYRQSFHARPDKKDKSRPIAYCDDCHDTHTFSIPGKGKPGHDEWRLNSMNVCGTCHDEALEMYTDSAHGKQTVGKKNAKAAVCYDCHTAHAIGNTSAAPVKLAITANCGNCHQDKYESYKATYHGQVNTLGYASTAKCFDCHGSHDILSAEEADSKVHPDNVLSTCKSCHNGKKVAIVATAGFATFQPHGHTDDFERFPQMWVAFRMMVGLLIGTFAFFWLHTALWFYRELKDRKEGKLRQHVKAEALPAELQGKHVRRFGAIWRVAHLTFAISLMLLTLTGMPLLYADSVWGPAVMRALGGPEVAGWIHRIFATAFAGVFVWHLGYVAIRLYRDRKTFTWFGPNSLVPGLQDLKDIMAMFRWFLGQGPRPLFDRWTYWEKFDYWAPFWGVTIIGVSGLMMWLPSITATYLPGWVFNVAAIFHGEEAFLAVVFLFTVHFFNNHFRPEKFPLELVMFTGSLPVEEFRHDHALEYERLRKSGELQKYLVEAPSRPFTLGSKVLGFSLIAFGLVLLFGVGVGFLGGH